MSPPRDCVPALRAVHMTAMAEWASTRPVRHDWKGRTCRDLWDAAPHGSWLLRWAERAGADRRDLVRGAAACVRPALRFVRAGENRPRLAVEAAEQWAKRPTRENREFARVAVSGVLNSAYDMVPGTGGVAAATAARHLASSTCDRDPDDPTYAAGWAATAHETSEGPESAAAASRACADEVRRLVPFHPVPVLRRRLS